MAITQELFRLGNSARRLNAGSDQLNRLIERIDQLLGQLMIGLDYTHPRPVDEHTSADHNGKRVIELSYVGYYRVSRNFHLAIKTVKVLESKLALATQTPGQITPLLNAPRRLRYTAVDVLPEVVAGLASQVDEMVGSLERRCATAESLMHSLEQVAVGGAEDSGHRRVIPPDDSASRMVYGTTAMPYQAGEASGSYPRPDASGTTQVVATPGVPDDGSRRTVALGSDTMHGKK